MNRRRFLTDSAGLALAPAAAQAQTAAQRPHRRRGDRLRRNGPQRPHRFPETAGSRNPRGLRCVRTAAEQARQLAGGRAEMYSDFRRVLERKDIDAVVIATPGSLACADGGDGVRGGQGRLRRKADLAQRSRGPADGGGGAPHQSRGAGRDPAALGLALPARRQSGTGWAHRRVQFAQCWNHNYSPDRRGMGFPAETAPPAGLDWDLWLGPAPKVGYTPARRNFRVFYDYAGGELTNWCVHLLDVVHWALRTRCAAYRDVFGRQVVLRRLPRLRRYAGGGLGISGQPAGPILHAGAQQLRPQRASGQQELRQLRDHDAGHKGTIFIDRAGYEITPQMVSHSEPVSAGSREAYDDLIGFGNYYTSDGGGARVRLDAACRRTCAISWRR